MKWFSCRDCGQPVTWMTSRKGNRYLAVEKGWRGDFGSRTWYPAHTCEPTPEATERIAEERHIRAERAAAKEALAATGAQAPEGRVKNITGTIVKIVDKGEGAGYRDWKMTVLTDEGWSCWMTIPSSLLDRGTGVYADDTGPTVAVNDRVVFTATVTRSDKDTLFGFGKRPIVKTLETAEVAS